MSCSKTVLLTICLCSFVSTAIGEFAALFGVASASTNGYRTKIMSSGDVVVCGHTTGSFSGFTNAGSTDYVVQKYSSGGVLEWTAQIGTSSSDLCYGIDVDSSNNIYITGPCSGSLNGGTYVGSSDVCYVKYNSAGSMQYTGQIGGTSGEIPKGLAVDATNGYFYIVGETASTTFDGHTKTGSFDQIWLKYDTATGTKQTSYQTSATSSNSYTGVVVDSSGNTWVVGYSSASTFLSVTSAGSYDVTLQKVTAAGSSSLVRLLGGTGSDYGMAIAIDTSGNVYVTGYSASTTVNGETSNGGTDIIIGKYNSAGTLQYTILAGGSSTDQGQAIAVDSVKGVFYVSGYTTSTSFYGSTVTTTSNFLLAYDTATGTRTYAAAYPSSSSSGQSTSYGITTGNSLVYMAGYTTGPYQGETLTGSRDGYLFALHNSLTYSPTATPSEVPTIAPSAAPTTAAPSQVPTTAPTAVPTVIPTRAPSAVPTIAPTVAPSQVPTIAPSAAPSQVLTVAPTAVPTVIPTRAPSAVPTIAPTVAPSQVPTIAPSAAPSQVPTVAPTAVPSEMPTLHLSSNSNSGVNLSEGGIAGIVIGAVAAAAACIFCLFWVLLARRSNVDKDKPAEQQTDNAPGYELVADAVAVDEEMPTEKQIENVHNAPGSELVVAAEEIDVAV
jgi:hypothetical protein